MGEEDIWKVGGRREFLWDQFDCGGYDIGGGTVEEYDVTGDLTSEGVADGESVTSLF